MSTVTPWLQMLGRIPAERARRRFRDFVARAGPTAEPGRGFLPNWHIDLIADHLQAVSEGHIRRLLITMPPGHAKSLLASVLYPAWLWVRDPRRRGQQRLPPVKAAADVPAALQSLTKAVARGKIPAQDAQAIANMWEKLFRVREVQAQQSSLFNEDTNVDLSRLTEEELKEAEKLRRAGMERGKDREH